MKPLLRLFALAVLAGVLPPALPAQEPSWPEVLPARQRSLVDAVLPLTREAHRSVVVFKSGLGEEARRILGTVIAPEGLALTKASELLPGAPLLATLANGTTVRAAVLSRDPETDLALVRLATGQELPALVFPQEAVPRPGQFLVSVGPGRRALHVGILGVAPHPSPSSRHGYLGIEFERRLEPGVPVKRILEGGAAERHGLRVGDVITGVDGEPVLGDQDLVRYLRRTRPGDRVRLRLVRNGEVLQLEVELGASPPPPTGHWHAADRVALSDRRDGFASVLRHDAPLGPGECGGPVLDLRGRPVGLNIARADRTATLALPAPAVAAALARLQERAKQVRMPATAGIR